MGGKTGNTVGRAVGKPGRASVPAEGANPALEESASEWLDNLQTALDAIGSASGEGDIADKVNALISDAHGDFAGPGLSAADMALLVGSVATSGKAGSQVALTAKKQAGKNVNDAAEQTGKRSAGSAGGGGDNNGAKVRSEGKSNECDIKPYRDRDCESGYEAHHIVPDFVLRTGNRKEGIAGKKRIFENPEFKFNDGPTICLPGHDFQGAQPNAHRQVHAITDKRISDKGKLPCRNPQGTAPLGKIIDICIETMGKIMPQCSSIIEAKVNEAFEGIDRKQPVRTTKRLPTGEARNVLGKTHNATTPAFKA